MRLFNSYCDAVGLDPNKPEPALVKTYFGYMNGVVVKCGGDRAKSLAYPLHDMLVDPDSKAALEAHRNTQSGLLGQAIILFNKALREEYPELNDALYRVCYNEAYARGHHAGHDEIAAIMPDVVEFAKNILEAV